MVKAARWTLLCISFSALVSFGQPAPPTEAAKAEPAGKVEVLNDIEIGKGGKRILHADIVQPKIPPPKPMPAVLWIHGGGWVAGTHKPNPISWLVQKGYFVATIEYRLSGEAKWPAQIRDCKLAVRWLRANATKYHVDPDRIGCWGYSAGGHLVACLGTMGDNPEFEGDGGYPNVSSRVQAVVDFSGPIDFTDPNCVSGGGPGVDPPVVQGLLGVSSRENPELWKQASPINYVKAGDPPFLIAQGDADSIVAPSQAVKLADALRKAGVPVELIIVKGAGHDILPLQKEVLAFLDKNLKP